MGDHPDRSPPPQLNRYGFPLRPEAADCQHYMQRGGCKFGPSCQFNHPDSWTPVETPNSRGYPPREGESAHGWYNHPENVPAPQIVSPAQIETQPWPSGGTAAPLPFTMPGIGQL